MNQQWGKYIIIVGIIIVLAGVLFYFFPGIFRWMGKLPGDIRVEDKNFKFYFPLVTMLIISIVLTILINVFKKFL